MRKLKIEIDGKTLETIEKLAAEIRITPIELVRRSLAVYNYLQDELAMASAVLVKRVDGSLIEVEVL